MIINEFNFKEIFSLQTEYCFVYTLKERVILDLVVIAYSTAAGLANKLNPFRVKLGSCLVIGCNMLATMFKLSLIELDDVMT